MKRKEIELLVSDKGISYTKLYRKVKKAKIADEVFVCYFNAFENSSRIPCGTLENKNHTTILYINENIEAIRLEQVANAIIESSSELVEYKEKNKNIDFSLPLYLSTYR